jgi:hypothetical protein
MMILGQAQAGPWLQHVLAQGAGNGVAAVTALTLQPAVSRDIQIIWMDRLRLPHLAYWTARMTRHTWPPGKWQGLVEELRATAVSDRASAWYHWHRDIEPETIEAALREEDVEVLWQAELIHHARNCGQQLRRRMTIRLQANGCDREARLTLRWLNGRRRPDG